MGKSGRSSHLTLLFALGFTLGVVQGCARAPLPDYVLSEATRALPERHQQQIERQLIRMFGTPTSPRLRSIPPEGELEESEETESDELEASIDLESEAAAADGASPESTDVVLKELVEPARLRNGAAVYRLHCAGCHGVSGDGNGEAAAFLLPRPRDYRRGIYKFTSTPYGMKPSRADLVRTIRRGAKGTSMPDFRWLSETDLSDVIDYIILLSQRGEVEQLVAMVAESDYDESEDLDPAEFEEALLAVQDSWAQAASAVVTPVSAEMAYDDDSIAKGRAAFISRECSKCHGEDAKGQTDWLSHEFLAEQASAPEGERVQINYDAWGHPAPAADITARMLHGGRRPLDIYRRIYTGINGTPMPAFGDALANEPDTLWHLVHYVMSIVDGRSAAEPVPIETGAGSVGDPPEADREDRLEESDADTSASDAANGTHNDAIERLENGIENRTETGTGSGDA